MNRRREPDGAGSAPSVGALVRQLRMRMLDLDLGDKSRLAGLKVRLVAAIGLATSQGRYDCAAALARVDKALASALPDTVEIAHQLSLAASALA